METKIQEQTKSPEQVTKEQQIHSQKTSDGKIKFTQEEMTKFRELEGKYQENIFLFGQLHLEILDTQGRLDFLKNSENELKNGLTSIQKEESDFLTQLTDKYGEGSLSLSTGEFIPSKK